MQIDTAKKLRWYDREDLSQLISITTQEKQQLQDTVSALRQVPWLPPTQAWQFLCCLTPAQWTPAAFLLGLLP